MSVLFHIDGLILLAVFKSKEKLTNALISSRNLTWKTRRKENTSSCGTFVLFIYFFGFLFRWCYTSRGKRERENNRKMRWNSSKTPAAWTSVYRWTRCVVVQQQLLVLLFLLLLFKEERTPVHLHSQLSSVFNSLVSLYSFISFVFQSAGRLHLLKPSVEETKSSKLLLFNRRDSRSVDVSPLRAGCVGERRRQYLPLWKETKQNRFVGLLFFFLLSLTDWTSLEKSVEFNCRIRIKEKKGDQLSSVSTIADGQRCSIVGR